MQTGNVAENLLEALVDSNEEVKQELDKVKEKERKLKQEESRKHREKILQELGMVQKEGGGIGKVIPSNNNNNSNKAESSQGPQSSSGAAGNKNDKVTMFNKASMDMFNMDDDLEEEGFSCKVCKEGYSYLPENILGFYVYHTRVLSHQNTPLNPLLTNVINQPSNSMNNANQSKDPSNAASNSKLPSRKEQYIFTTVSNFNIIHYSCHMDAAKADAKLKPRKEEWEGAMLRNTSTLCNNIFPLLGPQVKDDQYAGIVEKYWNDVCTVNHRVSASDSTQRIKLLTHDFRILLMRFSIEGSFSEESKGGGRESNIRMVPFFIQMGLFMLDYHSDPFSSSSSSNHAPRAHFEDLLNQFLSFYQPTSSASAPYSFILLKKQLIQQLLNPSNSFSTVLNENPLVYHILSLFLLDLPDWKKWKLYFLQSICIYCFSLFTNEDQSMMNQLLLTKKASASDKMEVESENQVDTDNPALLEFLWNKLRGFLIFYRLVDKIQVFMKCNLPASATGGDQQQNKISHQANESWIVELKNRIRNSGNELAESSVTEIVKHYEESILPIESFDEFFDECG